MPTSAAAALVILLALVPGASGVYAFNQTVGPDWRQKEWQAAVQYIAFSTLGLLIYVLLAGLFEFLPAAHVIPKTYETISASQLTSLLIPFAGHLGCATLVGFLAAKIHGFVSSAFGASKHSSAWTDFVDSCVPKRWVVVTLTTGDVWVGMVHCVDTSVADTERDIAISEPALLDSATGQYKVTPYHSMHFPARIVQNVGVLANASDTRIGPGVGQPLFPKGDLNG